MWNKGWDEIFSKKDWGRYPDLSVVRFILGKTRKKIKKNKIKVLELGCGTGANLGFLAKEGFKTYGIDGSKVALKIAKKKLNKEKLQAKLYLGDVMDLSFFPNKFFDFVIDCECLYANSTKNTKIILKEINRVLKKKGNFFSKTFAKGTYGLKGGSLKNQKKIIKKGAFHSGYGLIRLSSVSQIKSLYGKQFSIKSIEHELRTQNQQKNYIKEWILEMVKR